MKITVTGGAGFIGTNFVHYWAEHHPKDQITVIDKLTYAGRPENLAPVKKQVELVEADICDERACKQAIGEADYIVHFAAESHVTRSEKDPEIFEKTNVEGTRTLLTLAANNDKLKRFVHISTDEVYGDAENGHNFAESEKEPGDSQATTAYAKSKARADDVAQEYIQKLPLNIVRPTNNFGPYQFPEKAFPRYITRVLSGKTISLWGEGEQIRDWLHARDTARAIELILDKAPAGEIYNVGANNEPEIKNRDLAHWLLGRMHDHNAKLEHQPDPRPQHDGRYGVDTAKIKQLGWQPSPDPWQLFEQTLQWYIDNKDWWAPLVAEAESIYPY